jgi:hypothetical protein
MDSFVNELREELSGPLIDPAHADYDNARAVWNGAIDRRPCAVARVRGVGEVATLHDFALVPRREGDARTALGLLVGPPNRHSPE